MGRSIWKIDKFDGGINSYTDPKDIANNEFADLVNVSVNQTLARTIITSGTTGVAVLALFVFGGEVLEGFAFTMLVGVLSGTYSTIFIAAMIAIFITERKAERVRQANVPVVSKSETTPQRSKRRSRKARAS